MNILIVSFFFPPDNIIGAVRVGKLAKFLNQEGHDIRVLCCQNNLHDATQELEIPAEKVHRTNWIDVAGIPRTIAGRIKSLVGKKAGTSSTATPHVRPDQKEKFNLTQFLKRSAMAILYFPDIAAGWLPYGLSEGHKIMKEFQPDLILVSAPPFTACIIGARLSKAYNTPWVAEYRDLWSENQLYFFPKWRQKLDAWLEKRTLKNVQNLITIGPIQKQKLETLLGKETHIVMNGYDPDDFSAAGQTPPNTNRKLTLVYTGYLCPGYQDPIPLFTALSNMSETDQSQIDVRIFGRGNEHLKALAKQHNIAHLIHVNAPIPYKEALKQQLEADILLFFLWQHDDPDTVFTGKLFEYIGARRPILASGAQARALSGEVADLITKSGAGSTFNTPDQIQSYLEKALKQKQSKEGIPANAKASTKGLSRPEQFRKLLKIIGA